MRFSFKLRSKSKDDDASCGSSKKKKNGGDDSSFLSLGSMHSVISKGSNKSSRSLGICDDSATTSFGSARSKSSRKSQHSKKRSSSSKSKRRVKKEESTTAAPTNPEASAAPAAPAPSTPTVTLDPKALEPTPDYSVQSELDEFLNSFVQAITPELLDLFVRKGQELEQAGILEWAVKEGDIAPHFCLPDHKGKQTRINDLISDGPLILTFYRGGWCPYCSIELKSLQRYLPKFLAKGAKLVAISPELPEFAANTAKDMELEFPVLSDEGCKVGMDYGIDFVLDEELRPVYDQFGLKVAMHNSPKASFQLPVPATYVIDTDGSVLYSFVNTDYTKRAEPEEILNAIPDYAFENEAAVLHGSAASMSLASVGSNESNES